MVANLLKENCVFCSDNNHNSNRCAKVTDPSARKQTILQKIFAIFVHVLLYLSPKHKASKCNTNYICKKCNGRHHISICQKRNLKSTRGNNSGVGNNSTNVQQTLPAMNQHPAQTISNSYQQNQNNQTVIDPVNTVTNFSGKFL